MIKKGKLILCISNEFGVPIYNAKIVIIKDDINKSINTNLCGITSVDLECGEYILAVTANEFKGKKFKVKFRESCSFLSLNLKFIDNKIYGYIVDEIEKMAIKVNLLYEVNEGTYIKVSECICNNQGEYSFYNVPRGKYKIEAQED
ncbi:MAG: hypothetical protein ACRCWG_17565 [Sarcina sp.]